MVKNVSIVSLLFLSSVCAKHVVTSWDSNVRFRRQSGARNCTLPPYPENGSYLVGGKPSAKPGDQTDSAHVHISCLPGYRPLGNHILYCVSGDWSDELPKCVRFCRLDSHPSVRYRCQVTNDNTEESYYRDCNEYEPSETIVRPQCNEPNYHYTGVLSHMRCVEGRWNYIAVCQPECGTITPDGKTLVLGGQETKRGEFPWHAGIYRKDFTPYKLICGGSLVSSTVVISAAHCFWDKIQGKLRPASLFGVALGKLYRGWNNPVDDEAQKFDVVDIKAPARYQHASSNYQDDIAAVWLSTSAVYRPHVRPVCLDFDLIFDSHQLREGNLGKVAGWGIKDIKGNPAPVLKVLDLPYVTIERCIDESPATFRPFITSDKICAGYQNGSALCQGDSGGGLVFMARDRIAERYYLRGIVSTAPESEEACNAFARTSFTQIIKHTTFIEKNTISFDQNVAVIQQESQSLCILPPYPESGSYSVAGSPGAVPGQGLFSAQLLVTCNIGYVLERDSGPSCSNGRWTEDISKCIPAQIDKCKRPPEWGASHKCSDDLNSSQRQCEDLEVNGTFVTRVCSEENINNIFNRSIVADDVAQCVNGVWKGDLSCTGDKDCGRVSLPLGSELPWIAALYKKKGQTYLCAATIVSNKHVITASHCVTDHDAGSTGQPSEYIVAVGKLYPKYGDPRDDRVAQTSEVAEIVVPEQLDRIHYANDIALMVLSERLNFDTYVHAACVDWTFNVNKLKDAVAKTASWRLATSEGISYEKARLRSLAVRIFEKQQCLREIGTTFTPYLTPDKICAKDIVGQGVCRGDSGMGLVYPERGRYILLGVISVGLSEISCSADQPIGFSSVFRSGSVL